MNDFKETNFCKDLFSQIKILAYLCGCILPSDDILAILRELIFRIANITHIDCAYGRKKYIKAELLKLNKSVNIVCHYFHANYKETEIFYLYSKTTVINQFNTKNSSGIISPERIFKVSRFHVSIRVG